MTADRIAALLEPIQNRLNAATEAAPTPWESVGTGVRGGDHWYVCAEGQSIASIACNDGENEEHREPLARFFAGAPTDQARLLAAIQAVVAKCDDIQNESSGRGLDLQEDDFDRGWHGAKREAAAHILAAIVAALGGEA